jgi:hypothetical protein
MIYSSKTLIAATGAAGMFERDWPLPRTGQRLLALLAHTEATRMPTAITCITLVLSPFFQSLSEPCHVRLFDDHRSE